MPRRHTATTHTRFAVPSTASTCQAKKRYPNKLAATRAAELKNLEDSSLHLSVYQCHTCHKWHLTNRANSDD